jgi:calcium binding protein 39
VSRLLAATKISLTGEGEVEASPDVIAQVANEVYAQDLLSLMITHIGKLEFEVGGYSRPD